MERPLSICRVLRGSTMCESCLNLKLAQGRSRQLLLRFARGLTDCQCAHRFCAVVVLTYLANIAALRLPFGNKLVIRVEGQIFKQVMAVRLCNYLLTLFGLD